MDFGLLYDLIIAKPWGPTTELERFQATIDQMVLADQCNFTHCWMVEHHFLPEFSHSSAPDALLGAVAARTEQIRIGFGVKLMPFRYNHPIRNAELIATMDLVSKGRVEAGTGRSFSRQEMEGFGVDPSKSREEWEEGIRVMVAAWTNETVSWDSPTFQLPERCVVPKPVQKPHPPLWMATSSAESHEVAGRFGMGCLSFTISLPIEEVERRIGLYEAAFAEATPIGKAVNHNIGNYIFVHCAEDTKTAIKQAGEGIVKHLRAALSIVSGTAAWVKDRDIANMAYLQQVKDFPLDAIDFDWLDENYACIVGDPDRCIEKVKRFQEIGLTQMITAHDVWGMPIEQQARSIELFGKYVIPEFR